MKKIRILKTSYLKRKIKEYIIKLSLIDYKLFNRKNIEDNKNLLIITLDALGDNIIKSKTIEILASKYGKENTYILCKNKWKVLYEIQGYKNIFVDETKWNIFYKIKQYRKLNNIGFNTIAIMNHSYIPEEAGYIFSGKKYDMSENVEYILEKHVLILKKILGKEYSIEEIKSDIRKYFPNKKYNNIISIAIGASNNKRTLPINKIAEIIKKLREKFPNKNIVILGSGKKQENYYKDLIKMIGEERLSNYINKIPLLETIQLIKDSDFFIGYDSGLLNIAFTLGKKSICLHWCKEKYIWEHPYFYIKTLKGKGGKEFIDSKYGTDILNSITFEQIEEAINELEIN